REPLLFYERSLREALELDAAREAEQLRPLEAEQQCRVRLRPGWHDQEGAVPRPGSQPPAPSLSVAPTRRRSCLDQAQHGQLGPVQLAEHGQRGEAACVGSLGCPSEPAASVGCQPAAGSARASERVTCAEPPRGKKKSAETTSPRAGWCFHPKSPATCTVRFSSVSRTRLCVTGAFKLRPKRGSIS